MTSLPPTLNLQAVISGPASKIRRFILCLLRLVLRKSILDRCLAVNVAWQDLEHVQLGLSCHAYVRVKPDQTTFAVSMDEYRTMVLEDDWEQMLGFTDKHC